MAATDPRKEPVQRDDGSGRPTLASSSTSSPRRSRWVAIAIGVVVLAVIGVIAYMLLYGGDGGTGGGSGGGGGGYLMLALSARQARHLRDRMTATR
jgi:hypothetical protein